MTAEQEPPPFPEKLVTPELMANLKKGGFVLYMRHGPTDTTKPDNVPDVDLNDCSTQRPLTEAGRKLAAQVGDAVSKARIPIGEVVVSPLCRTKETALAAFGEKFTVEKQLMYTANLTSEQKRPIVAITRTLLSTQPSPGTNRVIVAHAPNMMDLIGYFIKTEASIAIFQPLGDQKFEYLGTILPHAWPDLIKQD